jgi:hypothetical protein
MHINIYNEYSETVNYDWKEIILECNIFWFVVSLLIWVIMC